MESHPEVPEVQPEPEGPSDAAQIGDHPEVQIVGPEDEAEATEAEE